MYNKTYEDYIRTVLGYPSIPLSNCDIYQNMGFSTEYNMDFTPNFYNVSDNNVNNLKLESCYPEIYKVVYPMVKKICMENTAELTEDRINGMTEEIFKAVENVENRSTVTGSSSNVNNERQSKVENRVEDRAKSNNPILRDLIKILILKELLGNSRPPNRPPFMPPRPRPPFRPEFPMRPNQ